MRRVAANVNLVGKKSTTSEAHVTLRKREGFSKESGEHILQAFTDKD